jgi:hypothetical protein
MLRILSNKQESASALFRLFREGQLTIGSGPHDPVKIRAILAADQLEAPLLEGLSSAESELTPADWSAIRQQGLVKARSEKRESKRVDANGHPARGGVTWSTL